MNLVRCFACASQSARRRQAVDYRPALRSASRPTTGVFEFRRRLKLSGGCVHCGVPLFVGIVVGDRDGRRVHGDIMLAHSEEAADGHDISLRAASLGHRDVLDLTDILFGGVVDIEANQFRA